MGGIQGPRTSLIPGKQYGGLIFLGFGDRVRSYRGEPSYRRIVKCVTCGHVLIKYDDSNIRVNKYGCFSCSYEKRVIKGLETRRSKISKKHKAVFQRIDVLHKEGFDFPSIFYTLMEEGIVKGMEGYKSMRCFHNTLKKKAEFVLGITFKPRPKASSFDEAISQIKGVLNNV
jgi:hypothetical protein